MWPDTPSDHPFSKVPCPYGDKCQPSFCMFSHEDCLLPAALSVHPPSLHVNPQALPVTTSNTLSCEEGPRAKRLKLGVSQAPIRTASQSSLLSSLVPRQIQPAVKQDAVKQDALKQGAVKQDARIKNNALLQTKVSSPAQIPVADTVQALQPRKLARAPVQHRKRLQLLQLMRQNMNRLNKEVSKSTDAGIRALGLSDNQLNKLTVDEEYLIATQNGSVYENVAKNRVFELRKMTVDDWVKERRESISKGKGGKEVKKEWTELVDTGLNAKEEVIFLSHLHAQQPTPLEHDGYVTKQISDADLEEGHALMSGSFHNLVSCDRCSTRFQVFEQREGKEGALTSGGICTYHWGRKRGSRFTGEQNMTCCQQPAGSPGCTTHMTHVFKLSEDKKRLATIMPFVETPPNDKANPHTAICFDCEMGYTTKGMELLRLTAISWPTYERIIDVLVHPQGQILDPNTRFSGIRLEQFNKVPTLRPNLPPDPSNLDVVASLSAARDLLLSYISPTTPLIGHALENDLKAIRLIHPTFIDTVLLYPHRDGLPARNSLRGLTEQHLKMKIQQAGAAGHDSFEDAKAAGELVRLRIKKEWKALKAEGGWRITDDGVIHDQVPTVAPKGPKSAVKRKWGVGPQYDGACNEDDEKIEDGEDENL
ncbi:uncharacterized protein BDR25DRAFT_287863 [Lindgomyces ingoldianus]|uniref:Uncharacterized protein n=1 Tax=Lindgomyces ingoldianus TaxID=673940 RepID=A0ACB6QVB3_9PLEO|nr:uncharacterized protein BDR25DRAFT_287863 [Lindgomyces ingoldianus]KAF2470136.1 hypothetical protein BDR25DRAFT_287863 [Lindgomyces ingoldianus]